MMTYATHSPVPSSSSHARCARVLVEENGARARRRAATTTRARAANRRSSAGEDASEDDDSDFAGRRNVRAVRDALREELREAQNESGRLRHALRCAEEELEGIREQSARERDGGTSAHARDLEVNDQGKDRDGANSLVAMRAKVEALERELVDRANATAQAVSDALTQALEESEEKNRELERELERALWEEETRLTSLEAEMRERLESSSASYASSTQASARALIEAETARERAEGTIAALELELDVFERITADALWEVEEKLMQTKDEQSALERDLVESRSMISNLESQKGDIEQAMRDAEARFSETLSSAQNVRDELEARIRELEETIERNDASEEIAELTLNVSNLESQKVHIEQNMRDAEARFVDEIFQARIERDGLQARVRELEEFAKNDNRSEQIAQKSKTIADLERRKDELERVVRDNEARYAQEVSSARKRAEELDARRVELEARVRELEKSIENDTASDDIDRLLAELQNERENASSIRAEKESKEQLVGELKSGMSELESYLRREQDGRAKDRATLEATLNKLRGDASALEDQVILAQTKLEDAESRATQDASAFDAERRELLTKIGALEMLVSESLANGGGAYDVEQLRLDFERREAEFVKEKAKLQRAAELGIEIIKLKNVIASECDALRGDLEKSERERRALNDEIILLRRRLGDA